ncbi:TPA: SpaH/EbpB family LPXTG-anchored major pilin [Streptococcus suis]|nr:SpaH/EbpB family LPXTG-anchored major pilin [Streptococcus suis]
MKKIKVFALLATLFVGIFSNLFTPVVSAEEPRATVTIHKLQGKTERIVNTGKDLKDLLGLTPTDFLGGITFKVYNVTDEYYDAYNTFVKDNPDKSVSDANTAAATEVEGEPGDAPSGKTAVATQTTAGDGSAKFSLNAKIGTRDAVYLFVEQASGDVETIANNLVLSFPVYELNPDGTYTDRELTDIHLYPKNITKEIPFTKEITNKRGDDKKTDFSIGQTINYKLTATIPANIAETNLVNGDSQNVYNFFKFVDTFKTSELTFINANHSVTVSDGTTGTTLTTLTPLTPADYEVRVEPGAVPGTTTVTTALTAAGIDKLAPHANKEISFNYQMKINSLEYIDEDIVNTAFATFGHDGENGWKKETKRDSETVKTGGYKFVKVDVNNNAKTLDGAQFVVRKSTAADAEYFVATVDGGVWTTDINKAKVYTSNAEGIVDVKGLEYGTYQLQETKAPEGYALPTGKVAYTEFIVKNDSYKNIANLPLDKIFNTPKGFLPQTGGAGIILFVALGAAMVGLAGVYFTSRRKDS